MTAYAVKHLAYQRGPLAEIMKDVKAQPYSFTSKEPEASDAIGHYVFVIEVLKEKGITTYWLGYKYRAADKVRKAGGGKWNDEFDFKNIAHYPPDGAYLDPPLRITDPAVCKWLSKKPPGMAVIPPLHVTALDVLFSHCSHSFA